MAKESKNYFQEPNVIFKFMRLLNLLEPGKAVISLSKLMIYVMLFITVYVMINNPSNLLAVMASSTGTMMALLNYGFRRHVQCKYGPHPLGTGGEDHSRDDIGDTPDPKEVPVEEPSAVLDGPPGN